MRSGGAFSDFLKRHIPLSSIEFLILHKIFSYEF